MAILVLLSPAPGVGAVGAPVNAGDAIFAFNAKPFTKSVATAAVAVAAVAAFVVTVPLKVVNDAAVASAAVLLLVTVVVKLVTFPLVVAIAASVAVLFAATVVFVAFNAVISAFNNKPGTVGAAAVPLRSPANWIFPFINVVASGVAAANIEPST